MANVFYIIELNKVGPLCTQTQPVEEFYRKRGKLLEFELPGGIPQSWPKLLRALHLEDDKQSAIA